MRSWVCVIPGQPVGKGRPRFSRAGNHVRTFTPAKTRTWEGTAAEIMMSKWPNPPLDCPLRLDVIAVFARPKRLMRKKDPDGRVPHVSKPDVDNILKAVGDSGQMAGVYRDDSTIWWANIRKYYAAKDEGPRVEIRLVWE